MDPDASYELLAEGEQEVVEGNDDEDAGDDVQEDYYDSSEEDDEEEMQAEDRDFIADDVEYDEEEEEEDERLRRKREKKRKRKKHRGGVEDLDEDDLALVQQTTGIPLQRSSEFRRLKKRRVAGDDVDDFGDLPPVDDALGQASARKNDLERIFEDQGRRSRYDDDDDDDFVVDDDGERPEKGLPIPAGETGITADQWQDMFDIFGDGADYDYANVPRAQYGAGHDDEDEDAEPASARSQRKDLTQVFEPAELQSQMLTEEDEKVRQTDIPERMQLAGITGRIGPEEEAEETVFVTRLLAQRRGVAPGDIGPGNELFETVKPIISFMRQELLEVPFIMLNRKDYWSTETMRKTLSEDDLWVIYDFDELYRSFREKKLKILDKYKSLDVHDSYFEEMLASASDVDHVEDLSEYLVFEHAEKVAEKIKSRPRTGPRQNNKIESYRLYRNPQLQEFIKAFGISAKDLGRQVADNSRTIFPDDKAIAPEDYAREFMGSGPFRHAESVLRGVKGYLADAIAKEPQIRRTIRAYYDTNAVVTVSPTTQGKTAINQSHPYYRFKYLRGKPTAAFQDGQFLQILKGEEDGLLKVSINLKDEAQFFQRLSEIYLSDNYSRFADKWNEHRIEILRAGIAELLPMMQGAVKERLKKKAIEALAVEIRAKFKSMIHVAPREAKVSGNEYARVMVISMHQGPNKTQQLRCVLVGSNGRYSTELIDDMKLARLRKMLDTQVDQTPDVLVVAGNVNLQLRRLLEELRRMVEDLSVPIPHILVEDEVPRLCQYSRRAKKEFPTADNVMRYSISMARLVQNPIMEYAAMFDQDNSILTLNLHPLQHLLPPDQLLKVLERTMIDVANEVGIDINEAVELRHRAGILPFIAGLGPRKAAAMLRKISRLDQGTLSSRQDLLTKGIVTTSIFINCASMIRVRKVYEDRVSSRIDVLDDTRIHPEDYDLARKMAADALDVDQEEEAEYPSQHVQKLIEEDAEKIDELLLEDYAEEILKRFETWKRLTLETIKREIKHPYSEKREMFTEPSEDRVFEIITGETDKTLQPGSIIHAEVVRLLPKFAVLRLDSGLDGIVHVKEIAERHVETPEDVMAVGEHVKCKIIAVDKSRFQVECSMRQALGADDSVIHMDSATKVEGGDAFSWTADIDAANRPNDHGDVDAYFDKLEERKDAAKAQQMQPRRMGTRPAMKTLSHPLFKNMGQLAAESYLASRTRGEAVIRPSSRGPDFLTVSWKVFEGVYGHLDLLVNEMENRFKVEPPAGKQAPPLDEYPVYQEIDEVIVQHVEASARYIDQLANHRKFRDMTERELVNELERQKSAEPKHIAYGICVEPDYPTYFTLLFKRASNAPCSKAFIKVVPKGFKLKMAEPVPQPSQIYHTVDEVLNEFKKRMTLQDQNNQKRKQQQPSQQPVPQHQGRMGNGYFAGGGGGAGGWGVPPPPPTVGTAWVGAGGNVGGWGGGGGGAPNVGGGGSGWAGWGS